MAGAVDERAPAAAPVCDLVLLSWNGLEELQPCLDSLFRTTDVPTRLLIVDNASDRPVREFLATVKAQGAVRDVQVLQNETNEGFPRGMNRGLRASRAPFVCLLNNDLIFTAGWLREMLAVAEAEPAIGVVNPMSSTLGRRPPAGMSVDAFAASRHHLRGRYVEASRCSGFCFLIKRSVLDRIGLLSEEVDRFFFEDEDFCMRAQQAGFRGAVAVGAYVFHAEHRSVRLVPDREAIFERNRRWCYQKWGRWVRAAWVRTRPLAPGTDETRVWLEQLLPWVRRRAQVHVYAPCPRGLTKHDLFDSVGLRPHADMVLHRLPPWAAGGVALAKILTRRKKPFDILVAPEEDWARLARGWGWLHGAVVVAESDQERLGQAWQQRARSQLPS